VAIANALQLEAARRHASPFPLRHAKFEVTQPIRCSIIAFLLLIHYFTLWPWPSSDLWSWTFV